MREPAEIDATAVLLRRQIPIRHARADAHPARPHAARRHGALSRLATGAAAPRAPAGVRTQGVGDDERRRRRRRGQPRHRHLHHAGHDDEADRASGWSRWRWRAPSPRTPARPSTSASGRSSATWSSARTAARGSFVDRDGSRASTRSGAPSPTAASGRRPRPSSASAARSGPTATPGTGSAARSSCVRTPVATSPRSTATGRRTRSERRSRPARTGRCGRRCVTRMASGTSAPDGHATKTLGGLPKACRDGADFTHMARASDGAMWLADQGCVRLLRVTATGTTTVPLQEGPDDLAADASGGVWVSGGLGSDQVRHVDAAGNVTSVTLPDDVFYARDIAVAPDGSAWLAFATCRLVRVTPAGEASTAPAPIPAAELGFDAERRDVARERRAAGARRARRSVRPLRRPSSLGAPGAGARRGQRQPAAPAPARRLHREAARAGPCRRLRDLLRRRRGRGRRRPTTATGSSAAPAAGRCATACRRASCGASPTTWRRAASRT